MQNLLNQMQQASIKHIEFRDDRFVAAVAVDEYQPVTLVYLARAVTPERIRHRSLDGRVQRTFPNGGRPARPEIC
ncbi:hypothetical protein ACLBOM_12065 [Escherichia coli]